MKSRIKKQIEYKKLELLQQVNWLRKSMESLEMKLADEHPRINGLGEVQLSGVIIDRLCGELKVLTDLYNEIVNEELDNE